jgi:hypothetical protein
LDKEPAIMVREPDATMQPAPQDNQLMSEHRVLGFKPQLRLEWRGQDGQNETEQPDHSASLGDSITSSTQMRFSVHTGIFVPDTSYIFRPRHQETATTELCRINEDLSHRIFIAGFLNLPHNGAQATFQRLLVTHTEMLNEAFRIEWRRRSAKMIDVSKPRGSTATSAIELLHKLAGPG